MRNHNKVSRSDESYKFLPRHEKLRVLDAEHKEILDELFKAHERQGWLKAEDKLKSEHPLYEKGMYIEVVKARGNKLVVFEATPEEVEMLMDIKVKNGKARIW